MMKNMRETVGENVGKSPAEKVYGHRERYIILGDQYAAAIF